jgi:hypothetical protein
MTRAKDISKIITDADFSGTLDVTGTVTAGGLTVDTNTLFVDASTNEVGINTTNPFGELHVRGTSASVYIQSDDGQPCDIIFGDETDQSEGRIRYDSSDNMIFQVDNLREALRISNNGDISLYEDTGTTPKLFWDASAETLDVDGPVLVGGSLAADQTNRLALENVSNLSSIISYGATAGTGALRIITGGGGGSGGAEAMRIDSSGNVGIGTTSPNRILTVQSSVGTVAHFDSTNSSGSGGGISLADANTTSNYVRVRAVGNDIQFTSGNAERVRIDSSGNVGIGTDSPARELDVVGDIGYNGQIKPTDTGANGSTTNPSICVGYDFDTGFYRAAANTIGFTTGGSEAGRFDASGNLLVGTTSDNPSALNVEGISLANFGQVDASRQGAAFDANRMTDDGDVSIFRKNGSIVGSVGVNGGDLYVVNAGGVGAGLKYNSGFPNIIPCNGTGGNRDNQIDLGASSIRFDDIYATNGTIQTSDRNEKQDIEELSDAEQRVAVVAKGLMRKFRWKDKVAEKGDNARTHFGIIAQDLQDAFTAEGLDAGDYAMFTSNTWWELDGETYETEEEAPEGATEKTRLGVRYNQLLAFIISAI